VSKVELEIDGKIARIYLNRPTVLNAIDMELPSLLSNAVKEAGNNDHVHVIILSGRGDAFCAGYDLNAFAEDEDHPLTQKMPWDPIKDYKFMWKNNEHFMSLFHCLKPVICKIHGIGALAAGSDIALCSDFIFMENDAQIGYMPTRVWGTPTTAMWVYRLGPEKAKRMLFTGDKITGLEAEKIGLVLKAASKEKLDEEVNSFALRMTTVPLNQLAMQKILINQAVESSGLLNSQKFATIFDGISRHSPEGLNFKKMYEAYGWKKAVQERDNGTYDWTTDRQSNQ
jgi:enoyl-CoA hydratase